MPFNAPPVQNEKDALVAFLTQQQDALRAAVHGLTDAEAAAATSASALSPGGLVKHVTRVQSDWLATAKAAPGLPPAHDQDPADWGADFRMGGEETVTDLLAAYDRVCADVLDAVRRLDPDTPVPVPDAPWFPKDVEAWSVRWAWFHLLEELARHAGHADVVRESLDGAGAVGLTMAREGLPDVPPYMVAWRRTEPAVRGISTVTLAVDDLAKARDWYADLLGTAAYFDTPAYVEFELGPHHHQLGLLDARFAGRDWSPVESGSDVSPTSIAMLHVPDLDAVLERALGSGAETYQPPRAFGEDYRGASVVDPFGNVVGFMERPLSPAS